MGLTADPAGGWGPGAEPQARPSCGSQSATKLAHSDWGPGKRDQHVVNEEPETRGAITFPDPGHKEPRQVWREDPTHFPFPFLSQITFYCLQTSNAGLTLILVLSH